MTDTYPSGFPGQEVTIKRTVKDDSVIQPAANKAEFRITSADELPMEWELNYTLRQNNRATPAVDELAAVVSFYEAHRGQTDAFNFTDPLDGLTRLSRFNANSLAAKRVMPGWFEVTMGLQSVVDPASAQPTLPAAGDLVYPFAFPGLDVDMQREDLWDSKILAAPQANVEARTTYQAIPFFRWTLKAVLRENNRAGLNEALAMDQWFRYYRGRLKTFQLIDPVDGISKAVRFDSDLQLERIIPGWWSTEVKLITTTVTVTTTVTITSPA